MEKGINVTNKYLQTILYKSVYEVGRNMVSELNYKVHRNGR